MKVCTRCKQVVQDTDTVCSRCGNTNLKMMPAQPQQNGNRNNGNGQRQQGQQGQQRPQQQTQQRPQQQGQQRPNMQKPNPNGNTQNRPVRPNGPVRPSFGGQNQQDDFVDNANEFNDDIPDMTVKDWIITLLMLLIPVYNIIYIVKGMKDEFIPKYKQDFLKAYGIYFGASCIVSIILSLILALI